VQNRKECILNRCVPLKYTFPSLLMSTVVLSKVCITRFTYISFILLHKRLFPWCTIYPEYSISRSHAIAQAVSRQLPTAAAPVRSQVRSCRICGKQNGMGTGFLRVLRFPLLNLIPPTAPYSCIIRGWYNRPISGRRTKWTQSHPTQRTLSQMQCLLCANGI
jgi:hypothetical protein